MLRKWILVFTTICLIISLSLNLISPRFAEAAINYPSDYISLGDSIAYGLSATSGQGYSDLLNSYLQSKPDITGLNFYNLSHSGDQSSDLLEKLQNSSEIRTHLGKARIVTLSIGGNNLLSPVIRSIASLYHLDLSDPQIYSKLGKAIQADNHLENTLLKLGLSGTIETELDSGVTTFKEDWPKIIQILKSLAPNSQLYVLNVYNPFPKEDPFFSLIDPYVKQINSIIEAGKAYYSADIYTCFLSNSAQKPLSFDLLQGYTDPHPTQQGHRLIFQTLSILYELSNAVPWESKVNVPKDKLWTIKFNTFLSKSAASYVQVYSSSGIPITIDVKTDTIDSDSIVVEPPYEGYPTGSYYLLINKGLPAQNGQTLLKSVSMNFTVE